MKQNYYPMLHVYLCVERNRAEARCCCQVKAPLQGTVVQGFERSGRSKTERTDHHEGSTEEAATRTGDDEKQVPTNRRTTAATATDC